MTRIMTDVEIESELDLLERNWKQLVDELLELRARVKELEGESNDTN